MTEEHSLGFLLKDETKWWIKALVTVEFSSTIVVDLNLLWGTFQQYILSRSLNKVEPQLPHYLVLDFFVCLFFTHVFDAHGVGIIGMVNPTDDIQEKRLFPYLITFFHRWPLDLFLSIFIVLLLMLACEIVTFI